MQYLLKNGANLHFRNQSNFAAEQESQRSGGDLSPIFRRICEWNVLDLAESGTLRLFEHNCEKKSPDMINAYGVTRLYVACRRG